MRILWVLNTTCILKFVQILLYGTKHSIQAISDTLQHIEGNTLFGPGIVYKSPCHKITQNNHIL